MKERRIEQGSLPHSDAADVVHEGGGAGPPRTPAQVRPHCGGGGKARRRGGKATGRGERRAGEGGDRDRWAKEMNEERQQRGRGGTRRGERRKSRGWRKGKRKNKRR